MLYGYCKELGYCECGLCKHIERDPLGKDHKRKMAKFEQPRCPHKEEDYIGMGVWQCIKCRRSRRDDTWNR